MTAALPVLIVLGPGAGKGTQAKRLAERLGLAHISPGQLLRDAQASGGPLDENVRDAMLVGGQVPSEIIARVVQERLAVAGGPRESCAACVTAPHKSTARTT